MVRAARIELASLAWKAGILAIIRRPRSSLGLYQLLGYNKKHKRYNVDINKYINAPKEDIFHTSAYAKVARGGMGAGSAETFERRRQIGRNRQNIQHYGGSMIGRGHMQESTRLQTESSSRPADSTARPLPTRSAIPQRTFREPPTRGYNPYS